MVNSLNLHRAFLMTKDSKALRPFMHTLVVVNYTVASTALRQEVKVLACADCTLERL